MDKELKPILKKVIAELTTRSKVDLRNTKHEIAHIMSVLGWLYLIKPKPSLDLEIACLLHDCDRFFPRQRALKENFNDYDEYKKAHSKNSAKIAGEILKSLKQEKQIKLVQNIIANHEFGGDIKSDIIRDCDSLAFFNLEHANFYLKKNGPRKTRDKINFMYSRMSPKNQKFLKNHLHLKGYLELIGIIEGLF